MCYSLAAGVPHGPGAIHYYLTKAMVAIFPTETPFLTEPYKDAPSESPCLPVPIPVCEQRIVHTQSAALPHFILNFQSQLTTPTNRLTCHSRPLPKKNNDMDSNAAHFDDGHSDAAHFNEGHSDAAHFDDGHSDAAHFDDRHSDAGHSEHSDTAHSDAAESNSTEPGSTGSGSTRSDVSRGVSAVEPNTRPIEFLTQPPLLMRTYAQFNEIFIRIRTPALEPDHTLSAMVWLCWFEANEEPLYIRILDGVSHSMLQVPASSRANDPWSYYRFDLSSFRFTQADWDAPDEEFVFVVMIHIIHGLQTIGDDWFDGSTYSFRAAIDINERSGVDPDGATAPGTG